MGIDTYPILVQPKCAKINPSALSEQTQEYLEDVQGITPSEETEVPLNDFIFSYDASSLRLRGYMGREECDAWKEVLTNTIDASGVRDASIHFYCPDFHHTFVLYGAKTCVGPVVFLCFEGAEEDSLYFQATDDPEDGLVFNEEMYMKNISKVKYEERNFDGTSLRYTMYETKEKNLFLQASSLEMRMRGVYPGIK